MDTPPDSLSFDVAGLALIFLLLSIPFYWGLVICFEMKVFDSLLCRRGNSTAEEKSSVKRESFFKAHQDQMDPDIQEEQQRVKSINPDDLPVRVQDVRKNFGTLKAVNNLSFGL